jgi:hypothetical protein
MNSVYNYKWVLLFIDVFGDYPFSVLSMLGSTSTIFDISVGELDVAFERVFGYCVYLTYYNVFFGNPTTFMGSPRSANSYNFYVPYSVFLFSLFSSKS